MARQGDDSGLPRLPSGLSTSYDYSFNLFNDHVTIEAQIYGSYCS